MKKNLLLLVLFITCSATTLRAQWDSITRFNQYVNDLAVYNGNLFIAGGFTQNSGNTCYWSAYYDGFSITRQTTLIGGSDIRKIDVFGTDLYGVGSLNHGFTAGVDLWDGSTWIDGGGSNISHSGIYADGNDLYVIDDNEKVRKKTGTGSFQLFYDFAATGGYAGPIIRYNNKLIFTGSFSAVNGVPANNIAQWDGTNWSALGAGTSTAVYCMAVYNNELYVAGKVTTAGGNPVNKIAKWNGSAWSSVGNGVTSTTTYGIRDMKVTPAGLVIVGDFTQVGGSVTTKDVALWNGSQWYALTLNHGDFFVTCVEYYNGKIYVGTADFNHAHVFRYNGTIGIDENNGPENAMFIYPNPAKDKISIDLKIASGMQVISAYDISGKKKLESRIEKGKNQLDISSLTKGIYILELVTEKGIYRKKIVKD